MKKYKKVWLLFMMVCMAACSPVKVVHTEEADHFRLSDYQTFDFFRVETGRDTLSPEYRAQIEVLKAAIADEMQQRGLTQSNSSPDLLVNLGVVVEERVQTRETTLREAPVYIGQRRYSWKSEEVVVDRYQEGMVTVHLVDAAKNTLVWQGTLEGVVSGNPEKLTATIDKGISALFSHIPGAEASG